jgi:hypothetical protein
MKHSFRANWEDNPKNLTSDGYKVCYRSACLVHLCYIHETLQYQLKVINVNDGGPVSTYIVPKVRFKFYRYDVRLWPIANLGISRYQCRVEVEVTALITSTFLRNTVLLHSAPATILKLNSS